jgi:hypothetical protein
MPPSTRRTPTDRPGGTGPPVEPRGGSAGRDEPTGAGRASPEQDERTTMSLRLPFMTLSLTRPCHEHAHGAGEQAHRGRTGTAGAPAAAVGSGERLLFYAGLAALGAVGVIEWPVAAAIAAGTYIAAKTRPPPPLTPTPPPPPSVSGAPGTVPSAGPRTEIPDAPVEVGMPPHV